MKKETCWFEKADALLADVPVGPEIEFKRQVEAEVARIEGLITKSNADHSKTPQKLVTYASNHEKQFVHGTAIRQVLGHYGVLDAYDWEDSGPGLVNYQENDYGWTMAIRVPGFDSAQFTVLAVMSVINDIEVERRTVNYIART